MNEEEIKSEVKKMHDSLVDIADISKESAQTLHDIIAENATACGIAGVGAVLALVIDGEPHVALVAGDKKACKTAIKALTKGMKEGGR